MTFKELKKSIKENQKELASTIRRGKFLRKPDNRTDVTKEDKSLYWYTGYGGNTWFDDYKVRDLGQKYRHVHIAYCHFFNGTEYGMIESETRSDNKRNQAVIDDHIKTWESMIDEEIDEEAICLCA